MGFKLNKDIKSDVLHTENIEQEFSYIPVADHFNMLSLQSANYNKLVSLLQAQEDAFLAQVPVHETYQAAADEAHHLVAVLLATASRFHDTNGNSLVAVPIKDDDLNNIFRIIIANCKLSTDIENYGARIHGFGKISELPVGHFNVVRMRIAHYNKLMSLLASKIKLYQEAALEPQVARAAMEECKSIGSWLYTTSYRPQDSAQEINIFLKDTDLNMLLLMILGEIKEESIKNYASELRPT